VITEEEVPLTKEFEKQLNIQITRLTDENLGELPADSPDPPTAGQ
jgi:hypothetical protein